MKVLMGLVGVVCLFAAAPAHWAMYLARNAHTICKCNIENAYRAERLKKPVRRKNKRPRKYAWPSATQSPLSPPASPCRPLSLVFRRADIFGQMQRRPRQMLAQLLAAQIRLAMRQL
jgi:hypothetical protein